ncbi:PREDICTED: hexosaminidase D-like isoform X2 [Priapulus caudatus]|uniref:beta-N-acetylhexosaminidase n=1 Tax=Priapulus caudatus TaxID=37621 RepID=A0ABM1EGD8_PRICU|nr:PREDICTED: hexosaminidase D-like isoform X2 [Priapulus caudatus]
MNPGRNRKSGMRLRGPARMAVLVVGTVAILFVGVKIFTATKSKVTSSDDGQMMAAAQSLIKGDQIRNPRGDVQKEVQLIYRPGGEAVESDKGNAGHAGNMIRKYEEEESDLREDKAGSLHKAHPESKKADSDQGYEAEDNKGLPDIKMSRLSALGDKKGLSQQGDEAFQQQPIQQNMDVAGVFNEPAIPPVAQVPEWALDVQRLAASTIIAKPPTLPFIPPAKLVHLDLKGAPPKISYFKQMFPLYHKLGATGLLIEYEDMFPYAGELQDLAAGNAYTPDDIKGIVNLARENQLEIIPLIQTFGHMEFVLKYEKYIAYRENPKTPQAICPRMPFSMKLIQGMLDQVIAMHPGIRYLHIGSDEVYHLGECPTCKQYMAKGNLTKEDLFMEHIVKVASYVRTEHRLTPIMWDDMYRHIQSEVFLKYKIGDLVEPMVWAYHPNLTQFLHAGIWDQYAKVFKKVWVASSFKGATGIDQYVTNITHHLENHLSWLQIMTAYKSAFSFQGIALTGWQRYDHFAVLCELLPVATPSLALCLQTVVNGGIDPNIVNRVSNLLGFATPINITLGPDRPLPESAPHFPGGDVYHEAQRLYRLDAWAHGFEHLGNFLGFLTPYQLRRNFSSVSSLEAGLRQYAPLVDALKAARDDAAEALWGVYDGHTVAEWLEQRITATLDRLHAMKRSADSLIARRTWPRRPLDARPPLQ